MSGPAPFGRFASMRANFVASPIHRLKLGLGRRTYSDLAMTTIPEPLSGLEQQCPQVSLSDRARSREL